MGVCLSFCSVAPGNSSRTAVDPLASILGTDMDGAPPLWYSTPISVQLSNLLVSCRLPSRSQALQRQVNDASLESNDQQADALLADDHCSCLFLCLSLTVSPAACACVSGPNKFITFSKPYSFGSSVSGSRSGSFIKLPLSLPPLIGDPIAGWAGSGRKITAHSRITTLSTAR